MTWVIGASSILGAGALVSDVRVRFSDDTTAELLQKAHPVGNYIAAGFAGSVRIGFELIQSLRKIMVVTAEYGPQMWEPRGVAADWQGIAQEIFRDAPAEERANGSAVLLVGPSPTKDMGVPEFRQIEIARIVSPDFTPRFTGRGHAVRHIGSGGRVAEYKQAIAPLFRFTSGIHQAHVVGGDEWARQLAFSLTIAVRDNPNHGISEHFHVVSVRPGAMAVYTNDMTTNQGDDPPQVLKMPPVARSWLEFQEMANAMKANAAGAAC